MKRLLATVCTGAHFCVVLAAQSPARTPQQQILGRIDEIRKSLADRPIVTTDFPHFEKTTSSLIQSASDAAHRGYLYLGLEKMGQLLTVVDGTRSAEERAAKLSPGFPAF